MLSKTASLGFSQPNLKNKLFLPQIKSQSGMNNQVATQRETQLKRRRESSHSLQQASSQRNMGNSTSRSAKNQVNSNKEMIESKQGSRKESGRCSSHHSRQFLPSNSKITIYDV